MRGGHQMCIDVQGEIIYMFGGWDGNQDLADLWAYNIPMKQWMCLCAKTDENVSASLQQVFSICIYCIVALFGAYVYIGTPAFSVISQIAIFRL